MAKIDEIPKTNPDEIETLIKRLRQAEVEPQALDKQSIDRIERLLRFTLSVVNLVQRKNASIKRLRKLIFGGRTEKRQAGNQAMMEEGEEESSVGKPAGEPNSWAVPPGEGTPEGAESKAEAEDPKAKRKGHGRKAADEYPGAGKVECRNVGLKAGDRCPEPGCTGRLYEREPGQFLQFTGQPVINATIYKQEVLRCSACQDHRVAPLPEGVSRKRFDETADVGIVMSKYATATPSHRLSQLQESCGIPIAESVMYERSQEVVKAVEPVLNELEQLAADSEIIFADDTTVKILECIKEDKRKARERAAKKEKKGEKKGEKKEKPRATHTTGIVARTGDRQIAWYRSGRRHAGENVDELLKKRAKGLGPPIQMGDALEVNWSKQEETEESKCWVHARRNFIEIEDQFPNPCKLVLDAIGKLYEVEAETAGLDAGERLKIHQEKSGPVISDLYEWIEEQFLKREVEPNSSLGQAMKYLQNHRPELTKFLSVKKVPLDNNPAERILKRPVLLRNGALFFKTLGGAKLGDQLMSLIETCRLNQVNVWEYFLTLLRRTDEVKRKPEQFLPWNYPRAGSAQGAVVN
jgi:transposase